MNRFVIAISYHENDKPQADRLLRLIADNECSQRDDVEICLVRRFDTVPMTDAMVHAAGTFRVSALTTTAPWKGWPGGPNGMARDLLAESARRVESGEWADVDGLLMIEPDCVPCTPTWIDTLRIAWHHAKADGCLQMGAWRKSGGEFGHINGNCIVPPDLASRIDPNVIGPDLAWDCAIVDQVRFHWQPTGLIKNAFSTHSATEYDLRTPETGILPPALYHGCKSEDAISIAERWLR